MPSIDREIVLELYKSGKILVIAEQNNRYIQRHVKQILFDTYAVGASRIIAINTLDDQGQTRFIHSGTYQELIRSCGLSSVQLAEKLRSALH